MSWPAGISSAGARFYRCFPPCQEATLADQGEVLVFIKSNRLMGSGIGWVDAHLLCSARLTGVGMWTFDRRLAKVADAIGVAARP